MTTEEREALLWKKLPFFASLDEAVRHSLAAGAADITLEAGQEVAGSLGQDGGLLLLIRGRLLVTMRSHGGRELPLYRLAAGDCYLVSRGLFGTPRLDTEAEAECRTVALQLDRPLLSRCLAGCREAEAFFLGREAARLAEALAALRSVLLDSLEFRLAAFLLGEAERRGGDTVYFTQDALARYIGSAREAVSRTLKSFSERGLVTVLRGGVRLREREALAALCRM